MSSFNALPLPDKAELESRFTYDPITGILSSKKTGSEIRRKDASGYRIVTINGKTRRMNRVIWKMMTGEDAPGLVDYIDGDKSNNKWNNFQVLNEQDFYKEKKKKEINTATDSSAYGVHYYGRNKTWRIQLRIAGKTYTKYGFKTEQEALDYAKNLTDSILMDEEQVRKQEEDKAAREEIINDLFE